MICKCKEEIGNSILDFQLHIAYSEKHNLQLQKLLQKQNEKHKNDNGTKIDDELDYDCGCPYHKNHWDCSEFCHGKQELKIKNSVNQRKKE